MTPGNNDILINIQGQDNLTAPMSSATAASANFQKNLQDLGAAAAGAAPGVEAAAAAAGAAAPAVAAAGAAAQGASVSFFQFRAASVGLASLAGINPVFGQFAAIAVNLGGILPGVTVGMLGTAAAAVGIGIALKSAGDAAVNFNDQMITIRNNTTMTDGDFQTMVNTVKDLASTTGASTTDIADGFRHVTNEGYNAADAVKIVTEANQVAVATGSKTADTSNDLATAMHNFDINASEAGPAANALFTIAAQGNMTFSELADNTSKLFAVTGSLKGNLVDVGTAYDYLSRTGMPAAQVQTQMVNMMEHLVNPTAAAKKEIEQLSIATGVDLVHDFTQAGLAQKGLLGVLDDVKVATHGDTAEMFNLFGGIRGGIGAITLMSASENELAQSGRGIADSLSGEATPVTDAFGRKAEDTKTKVAELSNQFDLFRVAAGQGVSQAMGTTASVLMDLGAGFDHVGSVLHVVSGGVDGVTAAFSVLAPQLEVGVQATKDLASAVEDLPHIFGSVEPGIEHAWKTVAGDAGTIGMDIGGTVSGLAKDVGDKFSALGSAYVENAPGIVAAWKSVAGEGTPIAADVAGVVSSVEGDLGALENKFGELKSVAASAWSAVTNYVSGMLQQMHIAQQATASIGDSSMQGMFPDEVNPGAYDPAAAIAASAAAAKATTEAQANDTLAKAQQSVNDAKAQYVGQSAKELESKKQDLQSTIDNTQAVIDQLKAQQAAGDTSLATTDALNKENTALKEQQQQMKGLNSAYEEAKSNTPSSSGNNAAKNADIGAAQQPVHEASAAIQDLNTQVKTLVDNYKGGLDPQLADLNEKLMENASTIEKDTSAHSYLSNILKDVKEGHALTSTEVQKASQYLDQLSSELNANTDDQGLNADALKAAKDSLSSLTTSQNYYTQQVRDTEAAVRSETAVVKGAQDAVNADQEAVKAANQVLTQYKNTLTDLTNALSAAKSAESEFANAAQTPFTNQINQIQLQMDQIMSADMAGGMTQSQAQSDPALAALQQQLDQLKLKSEEAGLQVSNLQAIGDKFDFGTLISQLQKATASGQGGLGDLTAELQSLNGQSTGSMSMAQITAGIQDAQKAQQLLSGAIPGATAAVDAQQNAVDGLNAKLDADQTALQNDQKALQADQQAAQDAATAKQAFTDKVAALAGGVQQADGILQGDKQTQSDLTTQVGDLKKKFEDWANSLHDNVNPQVDALKVAQQNAEDQLFHVTNEIMSGHIPALNSISTTLSGSTIPQTDNLKKASSDLGIQLGVGQGGTTQVLTDYKSQGLDPAHDSTKDLTDVTSGNGGLLSAVGDVASQVPTATIAVQNFDQAIRDAQADASKGIDLDIRIHTESSGGGSGPTPKQSFGGGGIVGGTVGSPVPITAHAGEGVFTPDQMAVLGANMNSGSGVNVYLTISSGAVVGVDNLNDLIVAGIQQAQRRGRLAGSF